MVAELPPVETLAAGQSERYRERAAAHLVNAPPRSRPLAGAAAGRTVLAGDGRVFLDLAGGVEGNALGHAHPDVVAAVSAQVARHGCLPRDRRFLDPAAVELAERLARASGGAGLASVCLTGGAVCATRVAAALATASTGRQKIVIYPAGPGGGAAAGLASVSFARDPDALAEALDGDTAAVLVTPDAPFPSDLRERCTRAGALLVAYEVESDPGRTGAWFGFQHAGLTPDAVALASGVGGGLPLGAVLWSPAIHAPLDEAALDRLAGSVSPVACAAGVAAFDVIEREGLLDQAARNGAYLGDRIESVRAQFPDELVEAGGRGLAWALRVAADAAPILEAMEARGVLAGAVEGERDLIRLRPPLTIRAAELDVFVGVLRAVLAARAGLRP
ncbi:aminotransferase class III-fold pyridoxal phosphate-dependent enzyme [Spirillospora sp. NBC_00431]